MIAVACVATSVAGDSLFSIALWSMVVMDYAVEIYEGFHYSVDMWLGLVLVSLLWRVLEPLEGNHRNEYVGAASAAVPAIDGDGLGSSKTNTRLDLDTTTLGSTKLSNNYRQQSPMISTSALVLMYTPPVILAYMQLILFPQWMANFLIVLYTVVSLVIYVAFVLKEKMENRKLLAMHFTQHVLLSLLFMALGVYL